MYVSTILQRMMILTMTVTIIFNVNDDDENRSSLIVKLSIFLLDFVHFRIM